MSDSTAAHGVHAREQGSATPAAALPEIIDARYRLGELVRTGLHGSVWQARDLILERAVTVTVLPPGPIDRGERAVQFERVARLAHEGLATVYDGGTLLDDTGAERSYLVTEHLKGRTVHDGLRDGPFPPVVVAAVGAGLAATLAYLHGRGTVHGGVSATEVTHVPGPGGPAATPHVKLSGAGVAQLAGGGAGVSAADDVLCLGHLLAAMLTGGERPGPLPAGLEPAWAALLDAMTVADPRRRPTAGEVAVRLRTLANAERDREASAVATQSIPRIRTRPPVVVPAVPAAAADRPAGNAGFGLNVLDVDLDPAQSWADDRSPRRNRFSGVPWLVAASLLLVAGLLATAVALLAHTGGAPAGPAAPAADPPTAPVTSGVRSASGSAPAHAVPVARTVSRSTPATHRSHSRGKATTAPVAARSASNAVARPVDAAVPTRAPAPAGPASPTPGSSGSSSPPADPSQSPAPSTSPTSAPADQPSPGSS